MELRNCKKHGMVNYYQRKDQPNSWRCSRCISEKSKTIGYHSKRKRDIKQELVDMFGGKCSRCGYDRFIGALAFHHVDPSQKDIEIRKIQNLKDAIKEAKKCILVCSRCHRELHDEMMLEMPAQ